MTEEITIKCPKCGKEVENNKKFCPKCGQNLLNVQKNSTKEIKETTKLPDFIKYIIGGVVAIVLLISFPLINIFTKSISAQSQFKNYRAGVQVVMQEFNEALENQYKIDKKYYFNQDAIITNVLKKQFKYENLPSNKLKITFSNDFYVILSGSRRKCDLFVEGMDKNKACEIVNVFVPVNETSTKKYGPWGKDSSTLRIKIHPNKTEKFGNW